MNLKQLSSFLAGPGGLLVLIFFFVPWVTVSCSTDGYGEMMGMGDDDIPIIKNISGYELASGVTKDDYEEVDPNQYGADDMFTGMEGFEDPAVSDDFGTMTVEPSPETEPINEGFLSEKGDPKLNLLLVVGLIGLVVAVIGFLMPSILNLTTGTVAYLVPGLLGIVLLIFKFIQIEQDIRKWNKEAFAEAMGTGDTLPISPSAEILVTHYQIGFFMTFIGLVMLVAAGVLVFFHQEDKNTFGYVGVSSAPPQSQAPSRLKMLNESGYQPMFANNPAPVSAPPIQSAPPVQGDTKAQMEQARELIKAKQYKEARAVLKSVNHPKAKEWLVKLDELDPFGDL